MADSSTLQQDPLLEPGSFIQNGADPVPDYTPVAAERPSWLPEGWTMSVKVRTSGATAGVIDRYYFEPNSEHGFRSRKEVDYYLQTGTKRKKTDASADVQPSASRKKNPRYGSKKFDFQSIPEMTTWKYSNDRWVPFINGKMVSKATREEWDAVFQSLSSH